MLSQQAIQQAIDSGQISISPLLADSIEAAHVTLHLDTSAPLQVGPKQFMVARTIETIKFSDQFCGLMDGKSTLARQGISVAQSSALVETGTNNPLVLEIFNASDEPVILYAAQPIAKLLVFKVVDSI